MKRESMSPLWARVASSAFVLITFFAGLPAMAAVETRLDDTIVQRLLHVSATQSRLRLERVPLVAGRPADVELEEFSLWAPDGKIMVRQDDGSFRSETPEPVRYFGGHVAGYPESTAMFAIGAKGGPSGLVIVDGERFEMGRIRTARTGADDFGIVQVGHLDEPEPWSCGNDALEQPLPRAATVAPLAMTNALQPRTAGLANATQQYVMTLQIETDPQFYALFGSTSSMTNYITGLIAAMSVIYQRDIKTQVQIANIVVNSNLATDPWNSAASTSTLLTQVSDTYMNSAALLAIERSSVVLLSGKPLHGGIAWVGTAATGGCLASRCGQSVGAFAVCTSYDATGTASTPDPNSTQNGVLYGLPSASGNDLYWGLSQLAHEVGHNLGSPHTHCMALTAAEQSALGRQYVDTCYSGQSGCYSNGTTGPVSANVPVEKGTIMSYCHNIFSGPYPQSRYTFGFLTDYTHHVLDDPSSGGRWGLNTMLATNWPTMSGITAPASLNAGAAGTASISGATPGLDQSFGGTQTLKPINWQITGGTITAGQGTNSITFTAGASGSVVLRATASNTHGAGVTDTKTLSITSACALPVITTQPAGISIAAGASTTLSVVATGATSFAWFAGTSGVVTSPVSGATTSSLTVTPLTTTPYWVRITNACGSVNSNAAGVIVGTTGVHGDANGNTTVGVEDVFYLINFLFSAGPAPLGFSDANLNGTVGVDDVFYLINFLFSGGPAPKLIAPSTQSVSGQISPFALGEPQRTPNGWRVPVLMVSSARVPVRAFSLSIKSPAADRIQITSTASESDPVFTASPRTADGAAYLAGFRNPRPLASTDRPVVAEVLISGSERPDLSIDPLLSVADFGEAEHERRGGAQQRLP